VLVVGTAGFEPATPCSQSRIGRSCHLRGRRTAQVEPASWLSVVVRWGPFRTAVNGTLVAQPVRLLWYNVVPSASSVPSGEDRPRWPRARGQAAKAARQRPSVRSVANAVGAPVLRDQGPDRPAGRGRALWRSKNIDPAELLDDISYFTDAHILQQPWKAAHQLHAIVLGILSGSVYRYEEELVGYLVFPGSHGVT
jgi:hypothetical protein